MASIRNDRFAKRSHDVVRLALYPAVNRERFLDRARAELDEAIVDSHQLEAFSWHVEFAGEGEKQAAIVSGKLEGISPFARGRERLLQLLSDSGKHVSNRAGRYELRFRLNHCDLELSFDEAARRLFVEPVASEEDEFDVVKVGSLQIGEETRVDLRLSAERDWHLDKEAADGFGLKPKSTGLCVIAYSQSSSGILGALKSVICRLRPAYMLPGETPWTQAEFVRFAHDYQGRFRWSAKTPCRRYEKGFLLEIPAGRPFWLAAPHGDERELLAGAPVPSVFHLEHVGRLVPLFDGDKALEAQVREGQFLVRKLPGGLFFERAA